RYTERAENYSRFIDVNFNLSMDLPPGMSEQWKPLVMASGDNKLYQSLYDDYSRENAIRFLAFDERNANSILSSVSKARENARQVRENTSKETWEVLNDLYHFMQEAVKRKMWKKLDPECFKQIKYKLQLYQGIGYDTSPRTQGWYFNKLGQFLERADKTSRILDVKYHVLLPSIDEVGSPLDFLHWNALLKSVSGFNAYKKLHGKIEPKNIVQYLVLNSYFPRSILFCLINAEACLHEISDAKRGFTNPAEKEIGSLRSELEYADINDVFKSGLHEYLDRLQSRINDISTCVYEQYFRIRPNFVDQTQEQ
ncbi:MAG: alpha-E domain-containing protein, partial [Marinoscillum sp.]